MLIRVHPACSSFGMSANLMSLAGLAIGIGDDGRRCRGDGGERLPAAFARAGVRGKSDQQAPTSIARSGSRGDQPDRLRDHDHHRRVPAALLADGAGRQAVQADGPDHHLRDGGLAAAVADAGAGAGRADPQAQGGKGHLRWFAGAKKALLCRCWTGRSTARRSSSAPRSRCSWVRIAWLCSRCSARSSCRRCRRTRSMFRVVQHPLHVAGRVDPRGQGRQWTRACARSIPQVNSVLATIGRAEKRRDGRRQLHGESTAGHEAARTEWPDEACRMPRSAAEMQEVPRRRRSCRPPSSARRSRSRSRVEELISGVRATLALKVYGEDLDKLDRVVRAAQGRGRTACPAWPTCRPRPTRASRRWSSRWIATRLQRVTA